MVQDLNIKCAAQISRSQAVAGQSDQTGQSAQEEQGEQPGLKQASVKRRLQPAQRVCRGADTNNRPSVIWLSSRGPRTSNQPPGARLCQQLIFLLRTDRQNIVIEPKRSRSFGIPDASSSERFFEKRAGPPFEIGLHPTRSIRP